MKALALVLCLSLAPIVGGCGPKTAQTQPASKADQVIKILAVVQTSVMSAEADGLIPTDQARLVVSAVVIATQSIQAAPQGAVHVAQTALAGVRSMLTPAALAKAKPYLDIADIALAALAS